MANVKQANVVRLKMAERAQQQLELHFPNWGELWIWNRKRDNGFITVPRILPIAMQAIDACTKGTPAGHTLFCLWARSPDHVLVTIENPASFAAEAGFHGERAVDTWRKRMRVLRELQFIFTKKGASGEFHYVLLMNPIASLGQLYRNGKMQAELYGRFLERLADIGAHNQLVAFQAEWAAAELAKAAAAEATPSSPVPPPSTSAEGAVPVVPPVPTLVVPAQVPVPSVPPQVQVPPVPPRVPPQVQVPPVPTQVPVPTVVATPPAPTGLTQENTKS